RGPTSSRAVGGYRSGSGYADSDDRPSGARLVVSTRTSLVTDTNAWTSSAAPLTRCSQLSSTSRAGPGPSALTIPESTSAGAVDGAIGVRRESPAPSTDATSAATSASRATP